MRAMIGEEFPRRLVGATFLTMLLAGGVAWLLADASVARGLWWGGFVGGVYLALLAIWSRAFVVRAKGERLGLLERVVLLGGRAARMGWVALALIAGMKSPVPVNLGAMIGGFLIYRVLLFGVMGVQAIRSATEKTSTK
jgi:hypothetical protein